MLYICVPDVVRTVAVDDRVVDHRTGLEWERSPDVTPRTHADALTHCDGLISLGGHDDWRLPELDELASLLDLSNPGGNPDLPLGHPFFNVQSSGYWAATLLPLNPTNAWNVFFNIGTVAPADDKADIIEGHSWCVR